MTLIVQTQLQHADRRGQPLQLPCHTQSGSTVFDGEQIDYQLMYRPIDLPKSAPEQHVPDRGLQLDYLLVYPGLSHVAYRNFEGQVGLHSIEHLNTSDTQTLKIEDKQRFRMEYHGQLLWCYEQRIVLIHYETRGK